jgi:hypothetical protein
VAPTEPGGQESSEDWQPQGGSKTIAFNPRAVFALAVLVAAALLLAAYSVAPSSGPLPAPSIASAADKDCADFKNQKRAQKLFKRHNPRRDPHNLDGDGDRIACEDLPCPCSRKAKRVTAAQIVRAGVVKQFARHKTASSPDTSRIARRIQSRPPA